jgi:hypothetical protein
MSKKKKSKRIDQHEVEFVGTLEQLLDDFFRQTEKPFVTTDMDDQFDIVFNGEEKVIREFAIFLIMQLRGFIYEPESITINGRPLKCVKCSDDDLIRIRPKSGRMIQ